MKLKLNSKEPAWKRKTLDGTLKYFFEQNCPQLGGALTIEPVVSEIISIFDHFCPPTERMRMGQIVWYAVDVNERAGYGKSIDKCKLNPVVLDLVNLKDVDDLLNGIKKRERNKSVAARLFEQAFEQGGVLTNADVGGMMRLSPGTVSKYVCELERETGKLIPRRGNIHDLGPTLTHKRIICIKCLQEGKTIEVTARETNHSPAAVTRYINDFKRVHTCLKDGWALEKISYTTGLSKSLTKEYINLINNKRSES